MGYFFLAARFDFMDGFEISDSLTVRVRFLHDGSLSRNGVLVMDGSLKRHGCLRGYDSLRRIGLMRFCGSLCSLCACSNMARYSFLCSFCVSTRYSGLGVFGCLGSLCASGDIRIMARCSVVGGLWCTARFCYRGGFLQLARSQSSASHICRLVHMACA